MPESDDRSVHHKVAQVKYGLYVYSSMAKTRAVATQA